MIVLGKLSWSNMFSYGDNNSIDLSEHKLVQLVGNNGNGKSSIPLILEEVLFNNNSKGLKRGDVPNRNSGKVGYQASLEFRVNDTEYLLSVKRNATTLKATLLENGEDISGHTSTGTLNLVEEILDKDFKEFSPLVFQSGSTSLQFLTATDTNRKKFLISLLNLEDYVKMFETFKDLHKNASDRLNQAKASCDSIATWIKRNETTDLKPLPILVTPVVPVELSIEVSKLTDNLKSIESTNAKIQKNEHYKKLLSAISPSDVVKPIEGVKPTAEILKEIGSISGTVTTKTAYIKKVQSLPDKCPTCEQDIDKERLESILSSAKSELEALNGALLQRKAALNSLEQHNKSVQKKLDTIAEFEKYSSLVDNSLPSILESKDTLTNRIAELQKSIKDMTTEVDRVRKHNDQALQHNSKIDTISEQLAKFTKELEQKSEELASLIDETVDLELLKKAFSTNGLIAHKLENSVQELEKLTNEYLVELSDGRFQIRYVLDGDKLDIIISDNGVDVSIGPLSMGEKARVTTATLLAIRKLMASISKNKLNVLFLDETIDTLDADGKDRLVDVLFNEQDLNIFLISHGYSHPLIPKITVVKEDGVSRIEI